MRNPFHLLVIASLVIAAGFAAASAQDAAPELDIAQIRARAQEHREDAEALATTIHSRAETLTDDARATQEAAIAARAAYAEAAVPDPQDGPLDFDAMIKAQVEAESASLGTSPRFIAFASLGMPEASLKALVRDVTRAGGVTVLRGFPQGNSALFKQRLASLWSSREQAGALGIDPRLFRAFRVEASPTFVVLAADFSPCDGFDCADSLPPHDRIAGNISVAEVLGTFVDGRGAAAAQARLHLARLEGDDR
jgi:conjugal transfer pilus assembly protein TrbC